MTESSASTDTLDLVVVGASAGGVEALQTLLGSLPPDFPAPLVIAQHVDPGRPSQLDAILQRATSLRIVLVEEQTRLAPGHVYIVPSNRHITIVDGLVQVLSDHQGRPRPSVDLLLATAARAYGERLTAVILTGSGTDGAGGAVEVKNAGGTVIIQNPATARYPSMPMALPPSVVDHVADLEAIGQLLSDLMAGMPVSDTGKAADTGLRPILETVSQQANIDFRSYKTSTIIRRIARRMAVTHVSTMREYAGYLQSHPQEVGQLVSAFLINVTQFFRDRGAFDYLRGEILPTLIHQARGRDRVLRFWSAGCATGEEPYSLAMLLADVLGAELSEWSVKIFATDLDEAAIVYARNGVYPENLLKTLPDDYQERFFERLAGGQGYRISKTLRQMVIFGQQDLSRSAPFPRIDLVMCRNVLIYFTPDLQDYVLNQFAFSLRPTFGYLFLGKAETVRNSLSYYDLVNKQWKVYRCIGGNLPMPRLKGPTTLQVPPFAREAGRPALPVEKAVNQALVESLDLTQLRRMNEAILRFLPIGIVIIDRAYHLISANLAARRLLNLREVTSDQDFLHAARALPYAEIRAAIDRVIRDRVTMALPEIELDSAPGGGRYVSVNLAPMSAEPDSLDLVIISIADVTEQVITRRGLETAQAQQAKLVADLETANQRLNETNKELIDANEELQVTNEELVLTHEELQATIEEFETTNEELQATNEELETNNEELQATNEELETTNDELRGSMLELQAVTETLETERARLMALLELAPFHIVVLRGPELIVESVDQRYARIIGDQQLAGRPLRDVHESLWSLGDGVVDLALAAYHQNALQISPRLPVTVTNEHGESVQQYLVFTLVPRRAGDGHADGVIVYVADETWRQLKALEEEREQLRLIFEHAPQVALALYDARTAELVVASRRYQELARGVRQLDTGELVGRRWHELAICAPPDRVPHVWDQVLASGQPLHFDELRLHLTGSNETVWDWHIAPLMRRGRDGAIEYVLVSAVEITGQVRLREELERLDRLKDEFLSSASHELRTPMTTLTGYLHVLRQVAGKPPDERAPTHDQRILDITAILQNQVSRLTRLISDLVDVSRLQTGKLTLEMRPVDAARLAEQAAQEAQMIKAEPPIAVRLPDDDAPLVVGGDPDRLLQVLLNLVQNAQLHAPESSRIEVRVSRDGGAATGDSVAQIAVQDFGPGIARSDQAVIFDRLRQASSDSKRARSGLGLGLYISRQIVEQHGGSLTVESEVGAGSTFTVRLPLHESSR